MELSHARSCAKLLPLGELLEVWTISGFSSVLLCQTEAFVYAKILDIRGDLKKEVSAGGEFDGGFSVRVDFADVHSALSYCYPLA